MSPVDTERVVRLPVGPLRVWINDRLAVIEEHNDDALTELASLLGLSKRRLYDLRYTARTISLDRADLLLCSAGEPTLLREMWPWLYDLEEI